MKTPILERDYVAAPTAVDRRIGNRSKKKAPRWAKADSRTLRSLCLLAAVLLLPISLSPAVAVSAVAALGVIALQYLVVRAVSTRRRALLSSLILLSSPILLVLAHVDLQELCVDAPVVQPPRWFPSACLGFGCMPWTCFPVAMWRALKRMVVRHQTLTRSSKLVLFAMVWLVATVGLLTIWTSAAATLLLAAAPAAAIICGALVDTCLRRGYGSPAKLAAWSLIGLCAVAIAYLFHEGEMLDKLPVTATIAFIALGMARTVRMIRIQQQRKAIWNMITVVVIGLGCLVPVSIYYFNSASQDQETARIQ